MVVWSYSISVKTPLPTSWCSLHFNSDIHINILGSSVDYSHLRSIVFILCCWDTILVKVAIPVKLLQWKMSWSGSKSCLECAISLLGSDCICLSKNPLQCYWRNYLLLFRCNSQLVQIKSNAFPKFRLLLAPKQWHHFRG